MNTIGHMGQQTCRIAHKRLQFPVTRHVLTAALYALVQEVAHVPPEPEPVVLGGVPVSAIWGNTPGGADLRRLILEAFARTEPCEPCQQYADELTRQETEYRADPVRNRLGLPYPDQEDV